ncbi:MAG: tRNA (adenosine(37)-N6)-dimethylallyltransferase MiaA [Gammaproteobacteria bacterium]|nr:tRNA (adenosine(37)-N6)-dimethylallyltransferase MiaA [Gammaproteobacteria bacterium]MDH3751216.1 tRNA (adenosine(37)-N6)-dimethylallyltransferase MiaA [Gammaproteobacteria bacterium]MDH3804350.1 tRNA (adenosine(37)-N6)-dimethylallyltransferase MiaA [Gammaproteobacteria bacterium]
MKTAICLMGPTASGKTDVAVSLCKRFPFDIISVDSALVYRGMDIGTAKPDAATLHRTPHRLIDIRDPEESYSAGEFVRDARAEMDAIFAQGQVPLLVGGTMMYFRALTAGIADLPSASAEIRAIIDAEAEQSGWLAMHERLRAVDPVAAKRVKPNDRQRIQRGLEVYLSSGKPLSEWQKVGPGASVDDVRFVKIALQPATRRILHERIEMRLNLMLNNGFVEEVKELYERKGLTPQHSSMRSVGYRQLWQYLDGECTLDEAAARALAATRQLAKRQITWLRSEQELQSFDPLEADKIDAISASLIEFLDA